MAWKPDYVTSTELKDYLRIGDTVDDAQIALAITSASRAIDHHTNRQFGNVGSAQARTYTARWDGCRRRWVIDIDDLMTTTGLTITTLDGTITLFALKPSNADESAQPWTTIVVDSESTIKPRADEDGVTVTANWGWSAVPTTIKQATLQQAARLFMRRQAPFGVAGSPDLGSEVRLLAKVDPDVEVVLRPYVRWWSAI